MEFCDITEASRFSRFSMHCLDHNLPADHCGPDGNSPVCKKYADEEGCSCCPENYDRNEKNEKLYKAAWDRLSSEEQEALKHQIEGDR